MITNLISRDNIDPGPGPSQPLPEGGLFDVARAGYRSTLDNQNVDARDRLIMEGRVERDRLFKEKSGYDLSPEKAKDFTWNDPEVAPYKIETENLQYKNQDFLRTQPRFEYYKDQHLKEMRALEPNIYGAIKTNDEILAEARQKARMSAEEFDRLSQHSDWKRTAAGFAGSLAAGIQDPLNLATMVWGGAAAMSATSVIGQTVKQGLIKTIGKAALAEGVENMAQEAVSAPIVAKWQNEVGNEYGLAEFGQNLAAAGILGGLFGGIITGAVPTARYLWSAIRENKASSFAAKTAAGVMDRVTHMREALPFLKGRAPEGVHERGLQAAAKALQEGRALAPDEIMPDATFRALDTDLDAHASDLTKARAAELKTFQGDVLNLTLESEKHLDTLSPKAINEMSEAAKKGELWRVQIEKADGSMVIADAVGKRTEAAEKISSLHLKDGDRVIGIDPVAKAATERPSGIVQEWDGKKGSIKGADGEVYKFEARDLENAPAVGESVRFDAIEGEAQRVGARKLDLAPAKVGDNPAVRNVVDQEIRTMLDEAQLPKGMSAKQAEDALAKGSGKRYEKLNKMATDRLENGYLKRPKSLIPELEKKGYSFEFNEETIRDDLSEFTVVARDGEGNVIGVAKMREENGVLKHQPTQQVQVDAAHQRQGIASAMYQLVEEKTGKTILPSEAQTAAGKALWAQKDRPFGNASRGEMVPPNGEYFRALEKSQDFTPQRFDTQETVNPKNDLAYKLGIDLEPAPSRQAQRQYLEAYNSEATRKAELTAFDELMETHADLTITDAEGNSITLKELAAGFEGDEKALKAMQSCSI